MFCKDNTKINLLQSIMSSICGTLRLLLIHLTLYDPGGGGFKSPSLRVFALTHLSLELHYCTLGAFPKK